MPNSVQQYFEQASRDYQEKVGRGLLGRLRQIETQAVMRRLSPGAGQRVLDAGCGAGHYTSLIAEAGASVLGVDFTPGMVDAAKRRGLVVVSGDLETLQLEERFDKILCAGALEFSARPQAIIQNLAAHLAERGILVLLLPRRSPLGLLYKLFHRLHGVRATLFSRRAIREMTETAGLHVAHTDKAGPLSYVVAATEPAP